jgi:hypothetical protein
LCSAFNKPLLPNVASQCDIGEFTKLGGLAAVEERLVGVQDIEAKLGEMGKRAELYQVGHNLWHSTE